MNQAGVPTRAVAKAAGVHHSFIDHLLSGRRTTCQQTVAEQIAAAVQAPAPVLFDHEEGECA